MPLSTCISSIISLNVVKSNRFSLFSVPLMAERATGSEERPLEETKKRKRGKPAAPLEKKAFRLADYTMKEATLHYKQLRLDENQRWGQVCTFYCVSCSFASSRLMGMSFTHK